MADQAAREVVQAPEMLKLVPDDPFIELAREISDLIARRAYELFESGGSAHGHRASRIGRFELRGYRPDDGLSRGHGALTNLQGARGD